VKNKQIQKRLRVSRTIPGKSLPLWPIFFAISAGIAGCESGFGAVDIVAPVIDGIAPDAAWPL
jgi:hypothetical protein